jgi:hypothetical protein
LLVDWKADRDLAGLRDEAELAKLPQDERQVCRALWSDVDALLTKTGAADPAAARSAGRN